MPENRYERCNTSSTGNKNARPLVLDCSKNLMKNKFCPSVGTAQQIGHPFMIIIDFDHKFQKSMFHYGGKGKGPQLVFPFR